MSLFERLTTLMHCSGLFFGRFLSYAPFTGLLWHVHWRCLRYVTVLYLEGILSVENY